MRVSPLGALVAIVVLGVTVEAVEQQSKQAAYALVIILLLGMVTFNATAFTQQLNAVIGLLNAQRSPQPARAGATATPTPFVRK